MTLARVLRRAFVEPLAFAFARWSELLFEVAAVDDASVPVSSDATAGPEAEPAQLNDPVAPGPFSAPDESFAAARLRPLPVAIADVDRWVGSPRVHHRVTSPSADRVFPARSSPHTPPPEWLDYIRGSRPDLIDQYERPIERPHRPPEPLAPLSSARPSRSPLTKRESHLTPQTHSREATRPSMHLRVAPARRPVPAKGALLPRVATALRWVASFKKDPARDPSLGRPSDGDSSAHEIVGGSVVPHATARPEMPRPVPHAPSDFWLSPRSTPQAMQAAPPASTRTDTGRTARDQPDTEHGRPHVPAKAFAAIAASRVEPPAQRQSASWPALFDEAHGSSELPSVSAQSLWPDLPDPLCEDTGPATADERRRRSHLDEEQKGRRY